MGGTLADVGGGAGVGTEMAVRVAPIGAYSRTIVLDPQRGMLERARRRREVRRRPELVRGSGTRLPFADQSVDVVLSFGVLCCMDQSDVPRAVTELWRVLRPGGYCVLGIPKGWAPSTDPMFRTAGFQPIREQRPGRTLFQRPSGRAKEFSPPE